MNKFLFETQDKNLTKNPTVMKVSKIEYQVKRHWLQNKVNFERNILEISENYV